LSIGLPSVFDEIQRKRDLTTREVGECKARINIDGSKKQEGIDYSETLATMSS
jgi:hypothetical protein